MYCQAVSQLKWIMAFLSELTRVEPVLGPELSGELSFKFPW